MESLNKIVKKYKLKEFQIEIVMKRSIDERLVLEFPYNVPRSQWTPMHLRLNQPPVLSALIPESDFDYEMSILVPDEVGRNVVDSCILKLYDRIKIHFKKFGRMLPPDLEQYIAETVLIIYSISKKIKPPMSDTEQKYIFKTLLFQISNELDVPVNLPFE